MPATRHSQGSPSVAQPTVLVNREQIWRDTTHPTVRRFKAILERELGPSLDMVVLYGSTSTTDGAGGARWDLAVFVTRNRSDLAEILDKARVEATDSPETHMAIHALDPERTLQGGPLLEHIARHGVPL